LEEQHSNDFKEAVSSCLAFSHGWDLKKRHAHDEWTRLTKDTP